MSKANKCQAFTNSGKGPQCSRNAVSGEIYCTQHLKMYQKVSQSLRIPQSISRNSLINLPKDVFTNIGKFLTYPEISRSIVSKLPKNISLLKDCAIVVSPTVETLRQLYQVAPNIKDLTLEDAGYNKFTSDVLANFKKLESLEVRSISISNFLPEMPKNLRYLSFDNGISFMELIIIIQNFKLEHLVFQDDNLPLPFGNNWIAPQHLKTFEFGLGERDINTSLQNFPHLKRFIYANHFISGVFVFNKLHQCPNLEVLEMNNNSGFRTNFGPYSFQPLNFPKNIRYLRCSYYEEYKDNGLLDLSWNKLEFIEFDSLRVLLKAKDFVLTLKNLQYLYINEINDHIGSYLDLFKMLKIRNPDIIFRFGFSISNEYFKSWDELNKIFTLSSLTKVNKYRSISSRSNNILILSQQDFTPEIWLQQNGYFVREKKCEDII